MESLSAEQFWSRISETHSCCHPALAKAVAVRILRLHSSTLFLRSLLGHKFFHTERFCGLRVLVAMDSVGCFEMTQHCRICRAGGRTRLPCRSGGLRPLSQQQARRVKALAHSVLCRGSPAGVLLSLFPRGSEDGSVKSWWAEGGRNVLRQRTAFLENICQTICCFSVILELKQF